MICQVYLSVICCKCWIVIFYIFFNVFDHEKKTVYLLKDKRNWQSLSLFNNKQCCIITQLWNFCQLAMECGMEFFETSAKCNINIEEAFNSIITDILDYVSF